MDSTEIQTETKAFRDEVADWSESKLREEGVARDVPGAETLDEFTLREAIVQSWRDERRNEARVEPHVGTVGDDSAVDEGSDTGEAASEATDGAPEEPVDPAAPTEPAEPVQPAE